MFCLFVRSFVSRFGRDSAYVYTMPLQVSKSNNDSSTNDNSDGNNNNDDRALSFKNINSLRST